MYLAQGAIISMDLGKGYIIGKNTSDEFENKIKDSICYFLRNFLNKESLNLIDCTPYDELSVCNGEDLKNRVKRANLSESSLHLTLNVKKSKDNSIQCSINEFDSKGYKFAKRICAVFEENNYRNKGIKYSDVYNLLYIKKPSIIVDLELTINDGEDMVKKCATIAKILVHAILSLGTK